MREMKSLSIVSTQMQLINCIEYISENNIEINDVVFFSASQSRLNQILTIFNLPCNRKLFKHKYCFTFKGNHFYDTLISLFFILQIWIWTKIKKIDVCILGNYRTIYGRYFWYKKKDVLKVVVDDGIGTPTWYNLRKVRNYKGMPEIFYNNSILELFLKRIENKMIPNSVIFYTIYLDSLCKSDKAIYNNYSYLKANICEYPNVTQFQSVDAVFLGQPLHTRDVVSYENYNDYLRLTAKYFNINHLIYYSHPEEKDAKWMEDDIVRMYKYIPNSISFEIYALFMKPGSLIISFQTSVQPILQKLCPELKLFSIYLNEIEEKHTPFFEETADTYRYLERIGIPIIKVKNLS